MSAEGNTFFQRNTITWRESGPVPMELNPKIRSKRATSVANLKHDPSKFTHREVFNSNLYSKVHFFDIHIPKPVKNPEGIDPLLLPCLNQISGDRAKENYNHLVQLLQSNPQEMQAGLLSISEAIMRLIRNLISEMGKVETQRKTITLQNTRLVGELKGKSSMNPSEIMAAMNREIQKHKKFNNEHRAYKQKYNAMEFRCKQHELKTEQLSQTIAEQSGIIQELNRRIREMEVEKQANRQFRDTVDFKIKRLKEELEIAHIVKGQNMADKMKFIMDW